MRCDALHYTTVYTRSLLMNLHFVDGSWRRAGVLHGRRCLFARLPWLWRCTEYVPLYPGNKHQDARTSVRTMAYITHRRAAHQPTNEPNSAQPCQPY